MTNGIDCGCGASKMPEYPVCGDCARIYHYTDRDCACCLFAKHTQAEREAYDFQMAVEDFLTYLAGNGHAHVRELAHRYVQEQIIHKSRTLCTICDDTGWESIDGPGSFSNPSGDESVPCDCQLLREVLTGDPFGWTKNDIPY